MKELPFKLPLRRVPLRVNGVSAWQLQSADGLIVASILTVAEQADAIVDACNALSTPPAPDAVKRYRVDVRDGVVEDKGDWIWPATTSQPMVLASDYDSLARQVAGLKERLETAMDLLYDYAPRFHKDTQLTEPVRSFLIECGYVGPAISDPMLAGDPP